MRKVYILSGVLLFLSACATQRTKNLSFNLWEPEEASRFPAATKLSTKRELAEVSLEKTTVNLCGLNFDQVSANVNSSSFYVSQESFHYPNLNFRFSLPGDVSVSKLNELSNILVESDAVIIENPLLPQIPLLPLNTHPEICRDVKTYHSNFSKNFSSILAASKTKVINISSNRTLSLKKDFSSALSTASAQLERVQEDNDSRSKAISPSLIIYDDLYEKEVSEIAAIYQAAGHSMLLQPLSKLPGLDANGPVPFECEGERLRECYHVWGDSMEGVSQLTIPSLQGFFAQTSVSVPYQKVSYLPGLIRAYIRGINKATPLKGVFLIGNSNIIAPFYVTDDRYGTLEFYKRKLSTDIFYALPNHVLEPVSTPHYEETASMLWSCINTSSGVVSLRYWCNEGETRHWPNPALTAYRWAPYTPHSRVMKIKGVHINNQFTMATFQGIQLKDVVPVGRLYTRNDLDGEKDPVVEEYAIKILRWHRNLPSFTNNSVAGHGGGDDYAYEKKEIDQFEQSFGAESKIYASQHFVGGTKCSGRCEYVEAGAVFEGFQEQVNRTAYLFTAHGGAFGYQGPYPGTVGLKSSDVWTENIRRMNVGEDLRTVKVNAPEYTTLKYFEDGTLFGTALANSCHVNDIPYMENEVHDRVNEHFQDIDPITIAQQFLLVPNGGAINGFFNVDIGWAGSDSFYNAKFMQKMKIAHDSCGDIGEAARLTWFDMVTGKTDGAWHFHLKNRQLIGAPFNPMARKPASCKKKVFANQDVQNAY